MLKQLCAAVAMIVMSVTMSHASDLEPVDLAPMDLMDASLTVVAPDGTEVVYTAEQLEEFPTYRLTTASPWREEPAVFEGVLFTDILAASNLSDVGAVLVTAENDYQTSITREDWSDIQILVATRVDGAPHSRRARGPIQFIFHQDYIETSDRYSESLLVWMAARIEPQ